MRLVRDRIEKGSYFLNYLLFFGLSGSENAGKWNKNFYFDFPVFFSVNGWCILVCTKTKELNYRGKLIFLFHLFVQCIIQQTRFLHALLLLITEGLVQMHYCKFFSFILTKVCYKTKLLTLLYDMDSFFLYLVYYKSYFSSFSNEILFFVMIDK